MSKSTLTLYRIDNLVRGQNKIIEYIGSLLALAPQQVEMTNYQYQQLDDLTCTVKVVLPEAYQTPGARVTGVVDYNYASIVQDNKTLYYYILSKSWLSTSAIKITMELDTLNSFCLDNNVFNRAMFSKRSLIKRAHKDRYRNLIRGDNSASMIRVIDPYPEGNEVQLFTQTKYTLEAFSREANQALQWYLVYLTRNEITPDTPISAQNPVLLAYCADKEIHVGPTMLNPVADINAINRSDPRLIKIIRVPAPPEKINDVQDYQFLEASTTDNWEDMELANGKHFRVYKMATLPPKGAFESSYKIPYDPNPVYPNPATPDNPLTDFVETIPLSYLHVDFARVLKDPKLYNSNYYYRKFYYDSFSWAFAPEKFDTTTITDNTVTPYEFDYFVSKNVNGSLGFKFPFPERQDLRTGDQDFPNVMTVSRNNEIALYNSDYLNYLKNGYNYDQKAKALSARTSIAQTVLGTASTVVGGILSATGVGAPVGAAMIAGGITTAASGALSTISSAIRAQNEIDRKIAQYQMQSASVSGSDDSDIMQSYGGNEVYERVYCVSNRMYGLLNDLFFYYGYSADHYGITEQDARSRTWFNFLQGDVELASSVYNDNIRQDIMSKFSEGVTIFHAVLDEHGDYTRRNLNQTKENWEVSLHVS